MLSEVATALSLLCGPLTATAQGTINFSNRVTIEGIDAPVTLQSEGVTGPEFLGQLFVMRPGIDSFEPVGSPTPFQSNPLLAGYVNGGNTAVPFIAPGDNATVILRAWNAAAGAIWSDAWANPAVVYGESVPITIALGGAGAPPSLPANLIGLQPFELTFVPEPTTIALFLLGLGTLSARRRRL